jgi:hypothetical protein
MVQVMPLGQGLLQTPQCLESLAVLTHSLPHRVRPGWHWQEPLTQSWLGGQALLQAPQWEGLLCVFTHSVPQSVGRLSGHGFVWLFSSPDEHAHRAAARAAAAAREKGEPEKILFFRMDCHLGFLQS